MCVEEAKGNSPGPLEAENLYAQKNYNAKYHECNKKHMNKKVHD